MELWCSPVVFGTIACIIQSVSDVEDKLLDLVGIAPTDLARAGSAPIYAPQICWAGLSPATSNVVRSDSLLGLSLDESEFVVVSGGETRDSRLKHSLLLVVNVPLTIAHEVTNSEPSVLKLEVISVGSPFQSQRCLFSLIIKTYEVSKIIDVSGAWNHFRFGVVVIVSWRVRASSDDSGLDVEVVCSISSERAD